jgi:hypothetical protein
MYYVHFAASRELTADGVEDDGLNDAGQAVADAFGALVDRIDQLMSPRKAEAVADLDTIGRLEAIKALASRGAELAQGLRTRTAPSGAAEASS